MACLDKNMYNSSEHKMGHHQHHHHHHHHYHHSHNQLMVSPRISFSNDFVDAQQAIRQEITSRSANNNNSNNSNVSSDFEFSAVTSHSMMSADELFFKGRLLPFKDVAPCNNSKDKRVVTTLKDELLHDEDGVTFRPAKGSSTSTSTRWRSLLGLKRAHSSGGSNSKKAEKATVALHEDAHVSKTSQDLLNEEVEFGI